jgi:hypothetical protein
MNPAAQTGTVMAGFIPAIHAFPLGRKTDVDARVTPGHDGEGDAKETRQP